MIYQIMRFTLVGGVGTSAHYVVLVLLVSGFGVHPVLGSTTGFFVGMFTNYVLNRRFTFSSKRSHHEALWRFGAVALVGIGINTVIMVLLTESMKLHYLLAQLIATALTLSWNFVGSRYWAFKEA
jgi:putative flippase GtrA